MVEVNPVFERIFEALYDGIQFDEYWATRDPNTFVFSNGNEAYEITVRQVPAPTVTPAQVEDGEAPHPYGWKEPYEPN